MTLVLIYKSSYIWAVFTFNHVWGEGFMVFGEIIYQKGTSTTKPWLLKGFIYTMRVYF